MTLTKLEKERPNANILCEWHVNDNLHQDVSFHMVVIASRTTLKNGLNLVVYT